MFSPPMRARSGLESATTSATMHCSWWSKGLFGISGVIQRPKRCHYPCIDWVMLRGQLCTQRLTRQNLQAQVPPARFPWARKW